MGKSMKEISIKNNNNHNAVEETDPYVNMKNSGSSWQSFDWQLFFHLIFFQDSHIATDTPNNKNDEKSHTTNHAVNGVETVTKSDGNTPGKCFFYYLLHTKPLPK